MAIRSNQVNLFLTLAFSLLLIVTQSMYFFNNGLGVLALYEKYPLAFNELTYWSQYQSDVYSLMHYSNPMMYNLIGAFINLFSKIFSGKVIFTLFPIFFTSLSFYLIIRVLDEYSIPKHWTFLIALLGLTSSSNSTLWFLITNFLSIYPENTGSVFNHFDLLISLSTSISLCIFLLLLIPSIRLYQLSYNPSKLLGFLWGLTVFVHPSIFFFGTTFITLNFLIRFLRMGNSDYKTQLESFFYTCLVPLIIAVPFIIINFAFFSSQDLLIGVTETNLVRELVTYCIFPFGMMYIASLIFKIDPYEVTLRFLPILILSLGELLLRTLSKFVFISMNTDFILDNISVYFLHFFYYVPLISILTRELYYESKSEKFLDIFFLKTRNFLHSLTAISYIPILGLSLFIIFSPIVDKINYKYLDSSNLRIQNVINIASAQEGSQNLITVFDSMESNIIINFIFRGQPSLNNFLIYGDRELSDFHTFFWKLYEHEEDYLLKDFHLDDNNFLSELQNRDLQIFYWLVGNRYQINNINTIHFQNDCLDDFMSNFNLVVTQEKIKERINTIYNGGCQTYKK